jgi:branched-chain amino acid transport system permease protein
MRSEKAGRAVLWIGLGLLLLAPFIGLYPIFMMKALCYAIFACAFNLLLGFTGLLFPNAWQVSAGSLHFLPEQS